MPEPQPQFVFMTCRPGAESAVKHEVSRLQPGWRLAYSRPGFLTFKHVGETPISPRQLAEGRWVFPHSICLSLGKVSDAQLSDLTSKVWQSDELVKLKSGGG